MPFCTRFYQSYFPQILTQVRNSYIVLIDGETLAQYMIEYNVGVTVAARYEIKRIDRDFFEEI
jgi:restriction system protein